MGALSPVHLILLLAIVLLVLGPGKMPEVGAALGKAIREFRSATEDLRGSLDLTSPTPPAPTLAPPAALPSTAAPPAAAAPAAEASATEQSSAGNDSAGV